MVVSVDSSRQQALVEYLLRARDTQGTKRQGLCPGRSDPAIKGVKGDRQEIMTVGLWVLECHSRAWRSEREGWVGRGGMLFLYRMSLTKQRKCSHLGVGSEPNLTPSAWEIQPRGLWPSSSKGGRQRGSPQSLLEDWSSPPMNRKVAQCRRLSSSLSRTESSTRHLASQTCSGIQMFA